MTTMGMKEDQAAEIATLITTALRAGTGGEALGAVDQRVRELAASFRPYPNDFAGHG
jgi:glycine/serine hydroxymethyltransferase